MLCKKLFRQLSNICKKVDSREHDIPGIVTIGRGIPVIEVPPWLEERLSLQFEQIETIKYAARGNH